MTDPIDADLLSIFRDEVGEYLATLNQTLLQIETSEASTEMLRELNRVAHSMKGAARAVGLKIIETIAHYMEEVFEAALRHELHLTPDVCDTLYDGLDLIQNVVDGEDNSQEALAEVLVQLEQVVVRGEVELLPVLEQPVHEQDSTEIPALHLVTDTQETLIDELTPPDATTLIVRTVEDSIRVPVSKLDQLMAESSELLVIRMQSDERQRELHTLRMLLRRWRREWQSIRAAYIRTARRLHDEQSDDLSAIFKFLERNQRHLLEMNRHLVQMSQAVGQDNLRLTMLADQLQDDISGMRLVSFETLIGGFQRIVRDLARDMNKPVHLEVSGTVVEVDKTVLDALKDPIMHLLRNAVDHGIEASTERELHGKPAAGHIGLAIEQRGSEVIVRVSDDGRGINPRTIRKRAVKVGILTTQEADLMNDDEARALIFHPGLTTSEQVTAISGRGIGMDVVRDRVEGLRGRVSVQSEIGVGTTVTVSVPVSLTRIRCVILHAAGEDYAVPSSVVVRMATLQRDDVFTAENRDMVLINDHPVPLVSLTDVLSLPSAHERSDSLTILALRAADRTVAFEVDALQSERELVLKALGMEIARAQFVSGAALLGTGEVIVVLDANDMVRSATGATLTRRRALVEAEPTQRKLRVLVVDDSITTRTLEKNILETAGFDVTVAIDGAEAWRIIADHAFDVVISDVEMPVMNGLELTRQIKSSAQTRHIPVILLTSLGKPEHQQAGLKAGADAYLVKSQFDQGELLRMIQDVV